MKKNRRAMVLAAIVALLMSVATAPAVACIAPVATRPPTSLSVDAAYTQFVAARHAFVQFRAFANPALVRWGIDDVRYIRLGRSVVDFKATMTFDIAGAEAGTYVPAERAALWIRVRRARAANGRIRTTWYDAHGGKGFERTPITNLLPPA